MAGTPSGLLRYVQQVTATPGADQFTDQQLLQRFAAGNDQSAFALLLRRHGPMVLGVCRRLLGHEHDAEDAFQAAFLTLARKAAAIRQADVGGYLYRVAYHLAARARADIARRKERERRAEADAPAGPTDDLTWREVRAVVGEELQRLPGEARSAVVLCYLEGRTHEEAARQLGWSKGTLRRRLDKGRELLRKRLLARGLAPVAALTATLFAEGSASPVPALLAGTTLRTAVGSTAARPAVAALAEAGLKVSSAGRAKPAAAIVVVMSALMGVGLWACGGLGDPPSKPAQDAPPARQAEGDFLAVRGRVLGPDGKPVAGARLYSPRWLKAPPEGRDEASSVERGKTDADGRFQLKLPREDGQPDRPVPLLAAADGFGLDWVDLPRKEAPGDVTLRLVKDELVRGRLVTTEGKPASGTAATVAGVMAFERLDDFLRVYQLESKHADEGTGVRRLSLPLNEVLGVKPCDKDGVFEIRGLGAERLALLEVRGPAVTTAMILVVTRQDFDAKAYLKGMIRAEGEPRVSLVGTSFEHVVLRPSEQAIEGDVHEAGSGKPVAGAVVVARGASAVTDARGHYRLVGIGNNPQAFVRVTAPKDQPLIGRLARLSGGAERKTVRADFELVRGVVVAGRVYDKSTGKGVGSCSVRFTPLPENKTPGTNGLAMTAETGADGRYRLVAIPGPGVLLAQAPGTLLKIEGVPIYPYKAAEFVAADRPRVKMTNQPGLDRTFLSAVGAEPLDLSEACKVVDVKDGEAALSCDLALDPGKTLTVNLEDPEGKPLAGAVTAGVSARILRTVAFKTATGRIYALDPEKPRPVAFLHTGRKLAALVTLRGDEKEPVVVRLAPTAVVTGRALDEDGQPLAGAEVYPLYSTAIGEQLNRSRGRDVPAQTDKEGRFRLEGVVPGLPMELGFRKGRQMRVPEKRLEVKPAESGQTLDVGDLRTKPRDS